MFPCRLLSPCTSKSGNVGNSSLRAGVFWSIKKAKATSRSALEQTAQAALASESLAKILYHKVGRPAHVSLCLQVKNVSHRCFWSPKRFLSLELLLERIPCCSACHELMMLLILAIVLQWWGHVSDHFLSLNLHLHLHPHTDWHDFSLRVCRMPCSARRAGDLWHSRRIVPHLCGPLWNWNDFLLVTLYRHACSHSSRAGQFYGLSIFFCSKLLIQKVIAGVPQVQPMHGYSRWLIFAVWLQPAILDGVLFRSSWRSVSKEFSKRITVWPLAWLWQNTHWSVPWFSSIGIIHASISRPGRPNAVGLHWSSALSLSMTDWTEYLRR